MPPGDRITRALHATGGSEPHRFWSGRLARAVAAARSTGGASVCRPPLLYWEMARAHACAQTDRAASPGVYIMSANAPLRLLSPVLERFGVDPDVQRQLPSIVRRMAAVCDRCPRKDRCRFCLTHGEPSDTWREFCANAGALESLHVVRRSGAPGGPAVSAIVEMRKVMSDSPDSAADPAERPASKGDRKLQ